MPRRRLAFEAQSWPLAAPFRFAGHEIRASDVVVVSISEGGCVGRGEATGVIYRGETPASICAQIGALASRLEAGMDRDALQAALPPGGARNAIDCALWDLACKRSEKTIWGMLGRTPREVLSCNTVGLEPIPEAAARAAALERFPLLKVKADRNDVVGRLQAIRRARPQARLFVDANGSWDLGLLANLVEPLAKLGVEMIEQPLAPGGDVGLADFKSPLPLCADESCFTAADVAALAGRYDLVNIKLDKCGGLTAALEVERAALSHGMETMVGNMIGTSLSLAPSYAIAQEARFVDLDGPLALVRDRENGVAFREGWVSLPGPDLWG